MRSNRNALLLEPVATPATVSQSRTSRKDALERNRAYAARKAAAAETAARNTEQPDYQSISAQLSSRSRSPHQRSSRSNKYGY
uniref:Uncharacterized protein n=1 Tax=Caenorhabditis japonica TaxID=281687 RepID=A0A8R1EH23_CAEJA